eukprot:2345049-Alexandrium_andersonii.AAC.1
MRCCPSAVVHAAEPELWFHGMALAGRVRCEIHDLGPVRPTPKLGIIPEGGLATSNSRPRGLGSRLVIA